MAKDETMRVHPVSSKQLLDQAGKVQQAVDQAVRELDSAALKQREFIEALTNMIWWRDVAISACVIAVVLVGVIVGLVVALLCQHAN